MFSRDIYIWPWRYWIWYWYNVGILGKCPLPKSIFKETKLMQVPTQDKLCLSIYGCLPQGTAVVQSSLARKSRINLIWKTVLSFSLLVAIGIEAFNKFSEEQKAESEEEDGESGANKGSSESDDKQSLCSRMSGKRLLKKIVTWTSAATSSTRVQCTARTSPILVRDHSL